MIWEEKLQQYLPLAVLKHEFILGGTIMLQLQQYLPLAVLKLYHIYKRVNAVSDLLQQYLPLAVLKPTLNLQLVSFFLRCNSTYRLRY